MVVVIILALVNRKSKRVLSGLNNFKKWIYLVVVPCPSIAMKYNYYLALMF